jgi:hypothetical protein
MLPFQILLRRSWRVSSKGASALLPSPKLKVCSRCSSVSDSLSAALNAASTSCSDSHSVLGRFFILATSAASSSSNDVAVDVRCSIWLCTIRNRRAVCGCLVLLYRANALLIFSSEYSSPLDELITCLKARPRARASSSANEPPAANAPPWACAASPIRVTREPKTQVGRASPAKLGYRLVEGVCWVRAQTVGFQF